MREAIPLQRTSWHNCSAALSMAWAPFGSWFAKFWHEKRKIWKKSCRNVWSCFFLKEKPNTWIDKKAKVSVQLFKNNIKSCEVYYGLIGVVRESKTISFAIENPAFDISKYFKRFWPFSFFGNFHDFFLFLLIFLVKIVLVYGRIENRNPLVYEPSLR